MALFFWQPALIWKTEESQENNTPALYLSGLFASPLLVCITGRPCLLGSVPPNSALVGLAWGQRLWIPNRSSLRLTQTVHEPQPRRTPNSFCLGLEVIWNKWTLILKRGRQWKLFQVVCTTPWPVPPHCFPFCNVLYCRRQKPAGLTFT